MGYSKKKVVIYETVVKKNIKENSVFKKKKIEKEAKSYEQQKKNRNKIEN